ncbi:tyrosine-type recombinase/integrase [Corynebacterium striatum]
MVQRKPKKGKDKNGNVTFIARWVDPDGKSRSKSFSSAKFAKPEKEAISYENHMRSDIDKGGYISPVDRKITLRDLVEASILPTTGKSAKAVRNQLLLNLGDLDYRPIISIKSADLHAWQAQLLSGRPWANGKPLANNTVSNLAGLVKMYFRQAHADGLILFNPAVNFKTGRIKISGITDRDLPTPEQIKALMHACDKGGVYRKSPDRQYSVKDVSWFKDVIVLAIETGLRVSELAGLQVGDVDFADRTISIERQCRFKAGEYQELKTRTSKRVVPLSSSCLTLIERLVQGKQASDQLIVTRLGRGTSGVVIADWLDTVNQLAGLERPVNMHSFRHLFATTILSKGVPLITVSQLLGHSNLAVTAQVYAHYTPDQRGVAFPALESLRGFYGDFEDA